MNAALMTARLPYLLGDLADGAGEAVPDLAVTGMALDSREIAPGGLFLAVRGHSQHGLAHVATALANGAAAVAWQPAANVVPPQLPVPTVAIQNLAAHASGIAARFWKHPSRDLFCIGVTGTDGKTSTAHLIAQTLDRLARPCAYFGTLGYGRLGSLQTASHTTPDAVRLQAMLAEQRDAGARACSMEVSSHALDQARAVAVEFDVGVLTNLRRDHLDYHGDIEQYAAAKRRLFDFATLSAAVLNRDDAYGARWIDELAATRPVTVYGIDRDLPQNNVRYVVARSLRAHANGLSLSIDSSWGAAQLESRLLGRFNAYNLLAALAALLHGRVPLNDAIAGLAQAQTVPGRIEAFRAPTGKAPAGPLVVIDYAHTPQALEAVLDAMRAHTAGKLICVFGCGGDKDRGKRPLMGAAAAARADVMIVTDDNPRSESPTAIAADILAGIPNEARARLQVKHDRASAIELAVRQAAVDDVVLIAGKGHEDYQIYGSERRAFSDRAFVADLLGLERRA